MLRRWWRSIGFAWGYCDRCRWRGPKRWRTSVVLKDLRAHTCTTNHANGSQT